MENIVQKPKKLNNLLNTCKNYNKTKEDKELRKKMKKIKNRKEMNNKKEKCK